VDASDPVVAPDQVPWPPPAGTPPSPPAQHAGRYLKVEPPTPPGVTQEAYGLAETGYPHYVLGEFKLRMLQQVREWRSDRGAAASAAFVAHWSALQDALRRLDPSALDATTAGQRLEDCREEVTHWRTQGVALEGIVLHQYSVYDVTDTTATVRDAASDEVFALDPEMRAVSDRSRAASASGQAFEWDDAARRQVGRRGTPVRLVPALAVYRLAVLDGTWKVVDGAVEAQ
jgi:hypothetical protein